MQQVIHRGTRVVALVAAVGLLGACRDAADSTRLAPRGTAPAAAISDGANGGNPHFYWLPPLAPAATYAGVFDSTRTPVVEVCEWRATTCGPIVAQFTRDAGSGSERVRVAEGQQYVVNWHTDLSNLDPVKDYRIRVVAAGRELGHLDVDVVSNGAQLRNVDTGDRIGLVNGRTLPIKFRIEEGALTAREYTLIDELVSGEPVLHANPGDPVYLTRPAANGETVQVLAVRDATGIPTRLLGAVIRAWDKPLERDVVFADAQGRPARVVLRDGSQVAYDYVSDSRVRLTVTLPDGNQAVTFADAPAGSFGSAAVSPAGGASTSAVGASVAAPRPASDPAAHAAARARVEQAIDRTHVLAFERQSAPAPATIAPPTTLSAPYTSALAAGPTSIASKLEVSVRVGTSGASAPLDGASVDGHWTTIAGFPGTIKDSHIFIAEGRGGGIYRALIDYAPTGTFGEKLDEVCRAGAAKIDTFCKVVGLIDKAACLKLKDIPRYGPAAVVACEAAAVALDLVCKGQDVCDLASKAWNEFGLPLGTIQVEARAQGNDFSKSNYGIWPLPAPDPMQVSILVPAIVSLTTNPLDPAPFQPYQALTAIKPALSGVAVQSSMFGTDGYSQSGSGLTNSAGEWGMMIPGSYEGVFDVISTSALGQTRTTSIVF